MAEFRATPVLDDDVAWSLWRDSIGDELAATFEASFVGAYVEDPEHISVMLGELEPYFLGRVTLEEVAASLARRWGLGD